MTYAKTNGIVKKGDKVICVTGTDSTHTNDVLTTKLVEWYIYIYILWINIYFIYNIIIFKSHESLG